MLPQSVEWRRSSTSVVRITLWDAARGWEIERSPKLTNTTRRPVPGRQTRWAKATAGWLARGGVSPNAISIASLVFASLSGACLLLTQTSSGSWAIALFIAAAAFIPFRLLSNMLDGMVAIEGGRKTRSGEIFNDLPDRLSDVIILICAGYSITALSWGGDLGWAAALLATITAYVRTLGAASGASQHFTGPMAKQQRMTVIALACLIAASEVALGRDPVALAVALAVVAGGCAITIARRTWAIVQELQSA